MDDRLELLRELERADEAVAAELAEVDELYAAVEELRARALELEAFAARLPEERIAAADAVLEAENGLAEARAALEHSAAALAQAEAAGDEERLADARRRELAARDSLRVADRLAAAARGRAAELEARAEAAEVESRALNERAAELAEGIARQRRIGAEAAGRPGTGSAALAEWGTRARAALLVARSQLAAEGDALIRQAHELAGAVLGEPLPALGTSEIVRRVEART